MTAVLFLNKIKIPRGIMIMIDDSVWESITIDRRLYWINHFDRRGLSGS